MSDFIDISITGDKKLQRQLARLDIKIQKKYVRQSINRAMLPVVKQAKAYAPVDSGRLKSSIKRRSSTRRGIARAMVVTGTRAELGIPENVKGYYPASIEYGDSTQSAKPFMRRALNDLKGHVINKFGDLLDTYIRRGA